MKNTGQHQINLSTIIPHEMTGKRLDQALAILFPDYSRARLQTWISDGSIKINDKIKRPKDKVQGGETVTVNATNQAQEKWAAQPIKLDIIHEDDHLLVINKPVGLVVHPAAGNPDKTLVNALLHYCPILNELPRAGIIHRLDKGTSGLLVVSKNLIAHTHLVRQLQARTVKREYNALVNGILISGGTINEPIGRDPHQRKKMAVTHSGKEAITHYRVIERFAEHTLLKVNLETGRTHQIRVHMAYIHHAIVGDATYGGRLKLPKNTSPELAEALRNFKHQALHAHRLGLIHPATNDYCEWQAPLPEDMNCLLNFLRQNFNL